MKNKIALSSLAMDLKRIALGIYHNSPTTAEKFSQEAFSRISETDLKSMASYMKNIILKIKNDLPKPKTQQIAENFLMYSTIIQNYCLVKLK